jgi:hypothetical protein
MAGFVPSSAAPASTDGELVPIALIDPIPRSPGTPNFDKPDPDRPNVIRSTSILDAIREGIPLPPVLLFQRAGGRRYELRHGVHRVHLSAALGFTHVAATVTDWKPDEY